MINSVSLQIMTDQLSQVLSSLSAEEDRAQRLLEIRPALSALSRKEVEEGLKEVDLCPLFDCLHSADHALVETASDILQKLLGFSDPALVLERYGGLMLEGLTSQDAPDCVQLLIMGQLQRCVGDEDLVDLVVRHNLLAPVISQLEGELAVAKEVTRWAVSLAESRRGLAWLTSDQTVGQLAGIRAKSSVLQMRVLELLVKIAQISEDHLQVGLDMR